MIDRRIDGELAELVERQKVELYGYLQHETTCAVRVNGRRLPCTCGLVKARKALAASIYKMLRALGEVD